MKDYTILWIADYQQYVDKVQKTFQEMKGTLYEIPDIIKWFRETVQERYDCLYCQMYREERENWEEALVFFSDEGHVLFKLEQL